MEKKEYLVAYYTGTGGTRLVAEALTREAGDHLANLMQITTGEQYAEEPFKSLCILYPIHAFNAPEAVYTFIERLPNGLGRHAAVISVSGGGEMVCNTAARSGVIARLEAKGYEVLYEESVVMPCNVIISTPEAVSQRLLELMPQKVEEIWQGLLHQRVRRTKPLAIDYRISRLGEKEKLYTHKFGSHIYTHERCNGCGICVKGCPAKNIILESGRAVFLDRCELCMHCLYACPQEALEANMWKFFVIKGGYRLHYPTPSHLESNGELCKQIRGVLWKGVRSYLLSFDAKK